MGSYKSTVNPQSKMDEFETAVYKSYFRACSGSRSAVVVFTLIPLSDLELDWWSWFVKQILTILHHIVT